MPESCVVMALESDKLITFGGTNTVAISATTWGLMSAGPTRICACGVHPVRSGAVALVVNTVTVPE